MRLSVPNPSGGPGALKPVSLITDRAKRYRAQHNVSGPRKCVLCGSKSDLQVMHLDGNESNGDGRNLAYGCRSCNQKLSAAFKKAGLGKRTRQYNPASGSAPTFAQYAWAVSQDRGRRYIPGSGWSEGAHDEAGSIIHATPKRLRVQYAKRFAQSRQRAGRSSRSEVPF